MFTDQIKTQIFIPASHLNWKTEISIFVTNWPKENDKQRENEKMTTRNSEFTKRK